MSDDRATAHPGGTSERESGSHTSPEAGPQQGDGGGLALRPFRALRPAADGSELAARLCPPYDVIDADQRARLAAADPHNAVELILPEGPDDTDDPYQRAARELQQWTETGALVLDDSPALYVYEMSAAEGVTRGLLGALELRHPDAGVVLPHENTMAGPVADRLALMAATEANLEPIYLVYDGGGAASAAVHAVDAHPPIARASTPDGVTHTLWALTDPNLHADIARDLAPRRALIADGHHRYATYRQVQAQLGAERGAGPWDRGLTLLVDSTSYGPAVHPIHRVLPGLALSRAVAAVAELVAVAEVDDAAGALARLEPDPDVFSAVLTDGARAVVIVDRDRRLRSMGGNDDSPLSALDVTLLHHVLVPEVWGLADTVETVGYAHSVGEATAAARASKGTAVLLRPTPVAAVAAVAAAGLRMPRKSTLFTPKPASGLVLRRFADET